VEAGLGNRRAVLDRTKGGGGLVADIECVLEPRDVARGEVEQIESGVVRAAASERAMQIAIWVSSVTWPGERLKGPPPTTSVAGWVARVG
jgi:hypothetical protein